MKTPIKNRSDGTASHSTISGNNTDQVEGYKLLKNSQACTEQCRRVMGYQCGFKQRGVVLFFALIALVVMSLAAVALIRSVDTSTLISGNLAFRQAAASSGDAGVSAASVWMAATQVTMDNNGRKVSQDPGCALSPVACNDAFNMSGGLVPGAMMIINPANPPNVISGACCQNNGYYSDANPNLNITGAVGGGTIPLNWNNNDSFLVGTDSSGNEIRYVIQRMCRAPDQQLSVLSCLFSSAALNVNGQQTPVPSNICTPPAPPTPNGCPAAGQAVMYRITARVKGSKDTISYIQSFVY